MTAPAPTPDETERLARMAHKRLTGALLMAGGGLIALLCGLCTLAVTLTGISRPGDLAPLALIFGGAPTGVGVVLFFIGRRMYREASPPRGEPWREFE